MDFHRPAQDRDDSVARRGRSLVAGAVVTALLGAGVGLATPAAAATTTAVFHDSVSINGKHLPATTVQLTAVSTRRPDSVVFSHDRRQLGATSTIVQTGDRWAATAVVDLTGLSGSVTLRTLFAGSPSSSVDKNIRVVPLAVAPTTPAPGTPTPVPTQAPAPAPDGPPVPVEETVEATDPTTLPAQPTADPTPTPTPVPTTAPGGQVVPEGATPEATVPTPVPTEPTVTPVPVWVPPAPVAGAANTGVPLGTTLTPQVGNVVVTVPGSVLSNVDLLGCVVVKANDVTIRNSRITCATPPSPSVVYGKGYRGLVIEDSEIDGRGTAEIAVGYSNFTLRRVEIRNVVDGVRASTNVVVENSWIHDLARKGTLHPDAVQSTGGSNITIRGNTLSAVNTTTGEPNNAAVMLGSETSASLVNVLVEDNHLDGGNMAVNVRGDTVASNIVFRRNVFGVKSRYGPMQAPSTITVEPTNIMAATGLPILVKLVV